VDTGRRAAIAIPLVAGLIALSHLSWRAARDSLAGPAVHERMGLELGLRGASQDDSRKAVEHLTRALELRPVSPNTWAALAEVKYRDGVADETFEVALRRAAALGPNDPALQASVVLYGLAVWDQLEPATREAVGRMLVAGLRRDAPQIMQIAERRGRLDVACRDLKVAARVSRDWEQLCKSTEAK
jgi:Flp pilus assembly protein TadD